METWEVLERAADEMERRGKAFGLYVDSDSSVCTIGAIAVAMGFVITVENNADAANALHRDGCAALCAMRTITGPETVMSWSDANDAPTVIAGLRAVAASLKAQSAQHATEPAAEPAKVTA